MILVGASVDDVYVIMLFTTFTGIMQGKGVSVVSFLNIPVSITLGVDKWQFCDIINQI